MVVARVWTDFVGVVTVCAKRIFKNYLFAKSINEGVQVSVVFCYNKYFINGMCRQHVFSRS